LKRKKSPGGRGRGSVTFFADKLIKFLAKRSFRVLLLRHLRLKFLDPKLHFHCLPLTGVNVPRVVPLRMAQTGLNLPQRGLQVRILLVLPRLFLLQRGNHGIERVNSLFYPHHRSSQMDVWGGDQPVIRREKKKTIGKVANRPPRVNLPLHVLPLSHELFHLLFQQNPLLSLRSKLLIPRIQLQTTKKTR